MTNRKIRSRLSKVLSNPFSIVKRVGKKGFLNWIPDALYLKIIYRAETGKRLDLKHPKTYNEKLQWIKLHDRKPEYPSYVDKYEVRRHIADRIGEDYLIPLIGLYESVEDIPWEELPNSFVLKCTHGSGSNIICPDKRDLDIENAKKKLRKWMNHSWYWFGREWPYKHIKPRIICEEYISDKDITPDDYKVLCFNGKAKLIEVHIDRYGDHRQDYYDTEWGKTEIEQVGLPNSDMLIKKPENLEKMLVLSENLSKSIAHVRIDWYVINERLYFGEITFFDGSGFTPFQREKDDLLLGSWINLP